MKHRLKHTVFAAGIVLAATFTPGIASAQTPYQGTYFTKLNSSALDVFLFFPAIPAGKRLILEQTRIRTYVDSGAKVNCEFSAAAPTTPGLGMAQYYLDAPKLLAGTGVSNIGGGAGGGQDYLGIDQPVRLFVDAGAGSTLTLHCNRSFASQPWLVAATIVGVLVDSNAPVSAQ